ncbi:hypothetical protein RKE30_21790 [Streptomyces sp. Li-HN-5-11]|nr:hypothetical protein [Streptomyces sp. Li-HN-5-11]WNM32834.1 hypothetical protein RKE30_21790 [Streptomyces sp. Li-HN-5-11]
MAAADQAQFLGRRRAAARLFPDRLMLGEAMIQVAVIDLMSRS